MGDLAQNLSWDDLFTSLDERGSFESTEEQGRLLYQVLSGNKPHYSRLREYIYRADHKVQSAKMSSFFELLSQGELPYEVYKHYFDVEDYEPIVSSAPPDRQFSNEGYDRRLGYPCNIDKKRLDTDSRLPIGHLVNAKIPLTVTSSFILKRVAIFYYCGFWIVIDSEGKIIGNVSSRYYQYMFRFKKVRDALTIGFGHMELDHFDYAAFIQDYIIKNNFSHWLLDRIPRLVEAIRVFNKGFSILHHMQGQPSYIDESLNLLGLNREHIFNLEHGNLVSLFCDNLFISDSSGKKFAHPAQKNTPWCINAIRSLAKDKILSQENEKKIYISRNKAGRRSIENEEDLLIVLRRYGYKVLFCEDLTLEDQIALFSSAESIISPHGAALSNIIFCKEETMVLEIFPSSYGTLTFMHLAPAVNIKYHAIAAEPIPRTSKNQDDIFLTKRNMSEIEKFCQL